MKSTSLAAAFLWALAIAEPAGAEVRETGEGSFVIESIVMADAAPASVYRDLIRSGSARNLKIDARGGGCFCEKLPAGGSVQHGRVIFAPARQTASARGSARPLQEMAVSGVLTFALAPDGPGTRITMTYRVARRLTMESAKLAPLVDQVMGIQLARLRDLASGRPVGR